MSFIITTTGTVGTVTFDDLGGRSFTHPVSSFDLSTEFKIDDIVASADVAAALSGGEITAVDADGNSIQNLDQLNDIQRAYNEGAGVSIPDITTDPTRQAFIVRQGSGANTDPIIKGQTDLGADTFLVLGDGKVTATSFNDVQLTTGGSATNYLDETGNYSSPSSGSVSAVTGTAPIQSTGGTTPAISILAATTSAAGSLSAADKTKLDSVATGAQPGIVESLTTTGTGASTLIGTVLNVPTPTTVSNDLVWDAQGDLVIGSGPDAAIRLGVGSGGAFLRSTGTNVEWSTATYPNSAATGDIIYASSLNNFDILTPGTSGHVLTSNGVGAAPSYQALSTNTGKTIYVDSINGNDGTGTRGDFGKPFLTILAASTATGITSGDTIQVRPGSYTETGTVTLPQGVSLEGIGGYEVTSITGNGTDTVILLSEDSSIADLTVNIPNSANNGIEYAGATGVAGVRFIKFNGGGGTTSSGLCNSGTGKIIALEIRYGSGDLGNFILCSDGILAAQAVHVPGNGVIQRVAKTSSPSTAGNRGRLQLLDLNAGNANVQYAIEIGTNGIAVLISLNLFNVKNGLLINGNNAVTDALGGKIQTTATLNPGNYPTDILTTTGFSVVVGPGLDLANAKTKIDALLEPNFIWDQSISPNAAGSEFSVNLTQSKSGTRPAAQRSFGSNIFNGFPERGTELMTGEGGSNATFNHVVQLDASDVVTDITNDAASTDLGAFGFGSVAANEKIAWCSIRRDAQSDWVKHWGILMNQSTAGVGGSPDYVFERMIGGRVFSTGTIVGGSGYTAATDVKVTGGSGDGLIISTTVTAGAVTGVTVTSPDGGYLVGDVVDIPGGDGNATVEITGATAISWTPFNVETTSVKELRRYANNVFLRADSKEFIRFGIESNDTWVVSTLDMAKGYWARVRVNATNSATSLPTFNQLSITPSHTMFNSRGQRTGHGLAQWRQTLLGTDFGGKTSGGGSIVDFSKTVGTGGSPTEWIHYVANAQLENNEYINLQFTLPAGLCTAFPLQFKVLYSTQNATITNATSTFSMLPLGIGGNLIADSAGGKEPIARAAGDTYNTTAAQSAVISVMTTVNNDSIEQALFDGFDVSSYYEDDLVLVRFLNTTGQTINVWGLIAEGVAFADGKVI
jgi:hypothetical protein